MRVAPLPVACLAEKHLEVYLSDQDPRSERSDSVVGTLALCTIPDARRTLVDAWRVLRPEGRLILLEHVRSPQPIVRGKVIDNQTQ